MILIVPRSDFSFLREMPRWFVAGFVTLYALAFAALLAVAGYAIWTLIGIRFVGP